MVYSACFTTLETSIISTLEYASEATLNEPPGPKCIQIAGHPHKLSDDIEGARTLRQYRRVMFDLTLHAVSLGEQPH